jgi:hypothetical protein
MTGMRSFGRKQKREQRRRNHIAKDLHSPKYKQRVKQPKRREERDWRIEEEDTY